LACSSNSLQLGVGLVDERVVTTHHGRPKIVGADEDRDGVTSPRTV
jgi:hypothetical protein